LHVHISFLQLNTGKLTDEAVNGRSNQHSSGFYIKSYIELALTILNVLLSSIVHGESRIYQQICHKHQRHGK